MREDSSVERARRGGGTGLALVLLALLSSACAAPSSESAEPFESRAALHERLLEREASPCESGSDESCSSSGEDFFADFAGSGAVGHALGSSHGADAPTTFTGLRCSLRTSSEREPLPDGAQP